MPTRKIVFLGSKPVGYECFKYLIFNQHLLDIEIEGVLTQERKEFSGANDLGQLAIQNGIRVICDLDELPECDIIYSVQYHKLLKRHHIEKARQAAINLHMAPLPEYRGSNQFSFAIIEGKEEFGTTIHLLNEGMDSGDIIFQKRFPIPDNCWIDQLYELTAQESVKLFKTTIKHIVDGRYTVVPQEALIPKYGTSKHFKNEIATLKQIDLAWEKEKIERHIRGTAMPGFEPPYTRVGGTKVYFDIKRD